MTFSVQILNYSTYSYILVFASLNSGFHKFTSVQNKTYSTVSFKFFLKGLGSALLYLIFKNLEESTLF